MMFFTFLPILLCWCPFDAFVTSCWPVSRCPVPGNRSAVLGSGTDSGNIFFHWWQRLQKRHKTGKSRHRSTRFAFAYTSFEPNFNFCIYSSFLPRCRPSAANRACGGRREPTAAIGRAVTLHLNKSKPPANTRHRRAHYVRHFHRHCACFQRTKGSSRHSKHVCNCGLQHRRSHFPTCT